MVSAFELLKSFSSSVCAVGEMQQEGKEKQESGLNG